MCSAIQISKADRLLQACDCIMNKWYTYTSSKNTDSYIHLYINVLIFTHSTQGQLSGLHPAKKLFTTSLFLSIHLPRYTEPTSSGFGHHHWRFCAKAFQAGCCWSKQSVHCFYFGLLMFACRSNIHSLWKCRGGWSHRVISRVSSVQTVLLEKGL